VGITKFFGAADWALNLIDEIGIYLIVLFSVVGAAAVGYAIYLGILLAKAEDEGKRKEAKSRIIKTVSGLFIIVILTTTLFNPAFYNAIFKDTKDMGDTSVTIRGMPMNAESGRYELPAGMELPLNAVLGSWLNYDKIEFSVSPANAATVTYTSSTGEIKITGSLSGAGATTVAYSPSTGEINTTGSLSGVEATITAKVISGKSTQNVRFNVTILPQDQWLKSYPYAIRFHANGGEFVTGNKTIQNLYGLSSTDKLTNDRLMKLDSSGKNDTSKVTKAWYERIGWASIEQPPIDFLSDLILGISLTQNMIISNLATSLPAGNKTSENGITVLNVFAVWKDARPPTGGNKGTIVIVPPTPPDPNPGGGGYTSDLGEVWGGTTLLPSPGTYSGSGGGTDKNPCTYKATNWERVMLARVINAEYSGSNLEHQIAVGEVIMRRVMSSQWGGNTIYDIISASGQYDTFSRTSWQVVQTRSRPTDYRWATASSSQAAHIVLNGTTNHSGGAYFQHNRPKGGIVTASFGNGDNYKFFDNSTSAKYKLKDMTKAPRS